MLLALLLTFLILHYLHTAPAPHHLPSIVCLRVLTPFCPSVPPPLHVPRTPMYCGEPATLTLLTTLTLPHHSHVPCAPPHIPCTPPHIPCAPLLLLMLLLTLLLMLLLIL